MLDPQAEAAVEAAAASSARFEDAFMGLEWLLARSPNRGRRGRIDGANVRIYVQRGDRTAGTPEIWVVYTYNDDQVVIKALRVLESEAAHRS